MRQLSVFLFFIGRPSTLSARRPLVAIFKATLRRPCSLHRHAEVWQKWFTRIHVQRGTREGGEKVRPGSARPDNLMAHTAQRCRSRRALWLFFNLLFQAGPNCQVRQMQLIV